MIGFKTFQKRFTLFHLEEREIYSNDVSVKCLLVDVEQDEEKPQYYL
jgi:hypothetical protein